MEWNSSPSSHSWQLLAQPWLHLKSVPDATVYIDPKCGADPLPLYGGKTAALITDNNLGVVFYGNVDCTGDEYEVRGPVPGEKCCNLEELLDFEPMCKDIICRKVSSCPIVDLLFILMRFIL